MAQYFIFLALIALAGCCSVVAADVNASTLQFGLINGGSAFFEPVREGWELRCRELGVNCSHEIGSDDPDEACLHRIDIVREWIAAGIKGIAITPCKEDEDAMKALFEEARMKGVHIVTFDSDVPDSARSAYVGTDNVFLGRTMARLLRQLRPEGGTFGIVGIKEDREEGFIEEITKNNDRDDRAHWYQLHGDFDRYEIDYMNQMDQYARMNATALIAIIQSPMREENWTQFVEANRYRKITYIGTDGSDYQLEYLNRRYVDGLVGQLPFDMGTRSLQVLYDLVTKGNLSKTIFPTNLVSYNLIPLELPPPDVDQRLIGNLKYVGFVCFALMVITGLACMAWTYYRRSDIVVRAAQPFFLAMVAGGVMIMSSSLVPLSFDDKGDPESMSTAYSRGICMSIPWLIFTGFSITFSALLSKTWRVNRLFHAKVSHARIQVSIKDVLLPFVVLLTSNIVVLICWTVLDPLTYKRIVDVGVDSWNREIFSYGGCRCNTAVAYLTPLALINLCAVCIACWQAYQARDISSEFSEAKYIGLTVFSLFQAFLLGIPVITIVRFMPEAFYILLTIMIFLLSMAVLLLIFLPKVIMQRKYAGMSESERKRTIQESLMRSSGSSKHSSGRPSISGRNFEPATAAITLARPSNSAGMGPSTKALARQMNISVGSSSEAAVPDSVGQSGESTESPVQAAAAPSDYEIKQEE